MKDLNLFKCEDGLYFRRVSNKVDVFDDLDCDGILIQGSEKHAVV